MNYCSVAKHIISATPNPYPNKLLVDFVELNEYPGIMWITLYAQNLAEFSDAQLASITQWLNTLKKKLNGSPLVEASYAHLITQREPKSWK